MSYDSTTALVVTDVQNDFVDPQGSLSVGGAPELLAVINDEIGAARRGGALVVYTQDWHPAHTPHFAAEGGVWPVHCVQGSWGAALLPGLEVVGPVIRKGTGGEDGYSGFTVRHPATGARYPTELEALLRERGVSRVVIVGVATDYCVRETALDARRLGFEVVVPTAAVRAVDQPAGEGARALAEIAGAGVELVGDRREGTI